MSIVAWHSVVWRFFTATTTATINASAVGQTNIRHPVTFCGIFIRLSNHFCQQATKSSISASDDPRASTIPCHKTTGTEKRVLDSPDLAESSDINSQLISHTIDACHYLDVKQLSCSDDMSREVSAIADHQDYVMLGISATSN
jgi:hypothetical protein